MRGTFTVSAIAGILYGFGVGTIVAVAMPYLEATTSFTPAQMSALVAAAMFASAFTTFTGGIMAEWWGRRRCIAWSSLVYALGVPFICFSGGSFPLVFTGLLIQGLAMGLQGIVVPLYIAEVLPPESRGRGAAFFQLFIIVGFLVSGFIGVAAAYVFGAADSAAVDAASKALAWRVIFSIVAIPAVALFLLSLRLAESPYWRKGGGAAAEEAGAAAAPRDPLLCRKYVVPFLLVVVLLVFHQGVGCNSVLGYSVKIFQLAGLGGAFANWADIAFKFVMLVATAIAVVLVERKGRRFLLLTGVSGCFIGLLGVTLVFFGIDHGVVAPSKACGIAATAFVTVFVAGFALGPGVCMWLILTEILPGRIRAVGMGAASVADITVSTALQAMFLPFAERFGYGPMFLILLVSSVCYVLCVWMFLPETKGKSLEEIERFFS